MTKVIASKEQVNYNGASHAWSGPGHPKCTHKRDLPDDYSSALTFRTVNVISQIQYIENTLGECLLISSLPGKLRMLVGIARLAKCNIESYTLIDLI